MHSKRSFLREMRKKYKLHRHLTPDWTKSWKIQHWEQFYPVCRAYDFTHTGKYWNILMPKCNSQQYSNIHWNISGRKTSQIFQCRNKIANQSNPGSSLINTNVKDLKWGTSEFTLTPHQQNKLFGPLPHIFWSFIRLCKQNLLKWKVSQKCWAPLFLSNKKRDKKAGRLNFMLEINKTAHRDFFRSKILFLMQNSA